MIRSMLCLLALSAVVTVGSTHPTIIKDAYSAQATPTASPAPNTGYDISGGVPVSLLIRNNGDEDDRLLSADTPIAQRVEVHDTRLVDGRQEMRVVPDGLLIPANTTLILEPGARHLMLLGLQADLVQGETFPLILHFAHAGEATVMVRVRRRVDAAGLTPFAPAFLGDLSLSLASAPPAQAETSTSKQTVTG